jgi:hypothetical protein
MSIIWPGLDLLVRLHTARQMKSGIRYSYPFSMYPPSPEFDRGTFSQELMDKVPALWQRLYPKRETGGRVQMDTIELRATNFALRANLDYRREGRQNHTAASPGAWISSPADKKASNQLKRRSQRVIHSLDRRVKQANSALRREISKEEFDRLIAAWTAHLLWMRMHMTYFKHLRPVIHGIRGVHQNQIDELMRMAERGIQNAGFESPEPKELRRLMRLFVRSTKRFREGKYTMRYMMEKKRDFTAKWYLAQFADHVYRVRIHATG